MHTETGYDIAWQQLLTRAQVASRLGVGVRTVGRLLARGDLEYVRIGHAVRVDEADLQAFIARCRVAAAIGDNGARILARELNEHDPDAGRGRVMTTDAGDRHVEV
jgi:excisionase family DNA binding protein